MSKKNKKDKKKNSANGFNKHDEVNSQSRLENSQSVTSLPPELSIRDSLEEKKSKKDKKKDKKEKKTYSANESGNHHYIEAQYATGNRFMVSSIPPDEQITIDKKTYEKELARLQEELVKLQEWIRAKKLKVVVARLISRILLFFFLIFLFVFL